MAADRRRLRWCGLSIMGSLIRGRDRPPSGTLMSRRRLRTHLAGGGLALATLGACGGGDDSNAGDATATTAAEETASGAPVRFSEELCDVITEQDLAAIGPLFSADVDVSEGPNPTVFCTYTLSEPVTSIQLFVYGGDTGEIASYDRILEGGNLEVVEGLGVAAARDRDSGTLEVWTEHSVRMEFISRDISDEVVVALAEAAIPRLNDHLDD